MYCSVKDLTVVKHNKIIEAAFHLSRNEQRFILLNIAFIDSVKLADPSSVFETRVEDFAKVFNLPVKSAYREIQKIADNLFERYLTIYDRDDEKNTDYIKTRWISSIHYRRREGVVSIQFAQQILPYLCGLKNRFTKYRLENVGLMTSEYGFRFYEFAIQDLRKKNSHMATIEVEIERLKENFQLENCYHQFKDLKRRVIKPGIEQVNKFSDVTIEWVPKRTGRRITHLVLSIAYKIENERERGKEPQSIPAESMNSSTDKETIELKKILAYAKDICLSQKDKTVIAEAFEQHGKEYVTSCIDYTFQNSKHKEKRAAYLIKTIRGDWAAGYREQQKQERERAKLERKQEQQEQEQERQQEESRKAREDVAAKASAWMESTSEEDLKRIWQDPANINIFGALEYEAWKDNQTMRLGIFEPYYREHILPTT